MKLLTSLLLISLIATTAQAQAVYEVVEGNTNSPVNRAPVVQNVSVSTDSSYAIDITLPGADADNDALSFNVDTSNIKNGAARLNGSTVTYTYEGSRGSDMTDSFTYTANDGKVSSAPATVTISIPKHSVIDSVVETVKKATRRSRGGGGGTRRTVTPTTTTPVANQINTNFFTRVLTVGSVGEDVKLLQQRLNASGYTIATSGAGSRGNETTYFGPATKAALTRYQTARGLANKTGTLDLATQISISSGGSVTVPVTPVFTNPVVVPISTPVATSFTRDLRVGSVGDDVLRLQQILNKQGFVIATTGAGSPGQEGTYFGTKTSAALLRFQRAKGLPAVGWAGPKTREYLNSLPK